jgi:hypothetical protein
MMLGADVLIAKEQHLMLQQTRFELLEGGIVDRLSQIDVRDLGAERARYRLKFDHVSLQRESLGRTRRRPPAKTAVRHAFQLASLPKRRRAAKCGFDRIGRPKEAPSTAYLNLS